MPIIIFFICDMFNKKMTQNNFYAIIILIRIEIYNAAAKRGFIHYNPKNQVEEF